MRAMLEADFGAPTEAVHLNAVSSGLYPAQDSISLKSNCKTYSGEYALSSSKRTTRLD